MNYWKGVQCSCPKMKPFVKLYGYAKEPRVKPLGDNPVEIVNHKTNFHFRVALPAAVPDLGDRVELIVFSDGQVSVEGSVTGEESSSVLVLNKRTRRLSTAAPFAIRFSLPATVDLPVSAYRIRRLEGLVFEVVVMKSEAPKQLAMKMEFNKNN